jgi:hypothetical protein
MGSGGEDVKAGEGCPFDTCDISGEADDKEDAVCKIFCPSEGPT